MTGSKEIIEDLQQQGYDLDNSAQMYNELKQAEHKLHVLLSQNGRFYKAWIDDAKVSQKELHSLLKIKIGHSSTLEYHIDRFQELNSNWSITKNEIDVS